MSKITLLLCIVLGLAIFLRVWGIGYGLPNFLVNDERALVYGALKMAELKTLIPAAYPEEFTVMNPKYNFLVSYIYLLFLVPFILLKYIIGSFGSFSELANHFVLNPTPIWLIARLVNAFFGVATVYLLYLIGKKIFNSWVGLISASFLSLSFLHIQLSHFTRPWVPMLFFTCVVMLIAAHMYKSKTPQTKHYLLMGAALGLAFGVSTAMAVIGAIFLLAHFLPEQPSFFKKLKDKNLWLALIVFSLLAAAFTLVNPQSSSAFSFGTGSLIGAKNIGEYFYGVYTNLKGFFFYEPIIFIMALVGFVIFWFKSKRILLVFLSWPVFYISALYFLSPGEFAMPVVRYLLLVVPWLILLASYAVYYLVSRMGKWPKIIVLVLIFIYPLAVGIQYDYLLNQKDTRALALEWVENNIPSGNKVITNWSYINPIPTKQAILAQGEIDKGSLRAKDRVLLGLGDDIYPESSYDLLRLAYIDVKKITEDPKHFLKSQEAQYFLREDGLWRGDPWFSAEEDLLKEATLIKEFKQGKIEKAEDITCNFVRPNIIFFSLERPGPTIKIYEL